MLLEFIKRTMSHLNLFTCCSFSGTGYRRLDLEDPILFEIWQYSLIFNLFTIMLTRNSCYIKVVNLLITTLMWRVQIKRWHIEISLLSDWSPISVKIIIKFLHKLDSSPDTELITYLPNVSRHKMWITYYNIPQ